MSSPAEELFSIQAAFSLLFLIAAAGTFISHFLLNNAFLTHGKLLTTESIFYVPKSWFFHFYIVATIWTALLRVVNVNEEISNTSVSVVLFFGHSIRRLYESLVFRMHVIHYLIGLSYYIAIPLVLSLGSIDHVLESTVTKEISMLRLYIGIAIFMLGNVRQYVAHRGIPEEYRLPKVLFEHYGSEVLIYVGLWVITLPHHGLVSWVTSPMGCVLIWVMTALGVSARNQVGWYKEKYGVKKVESRPWFFEASLYW